MVKGFKKKNSKGGHDFIPTKKKTTRNAGDVDVEVDVDVKELDDFVKDKKKEFTICERCGTKDLPCNCSIHDGGWFDELVNELKPKSDETPEQLYNRVEPIIEKINKIDEISNNDNMIYLNSLLADLDNSLVDDPDWNPDDGAKIENYNYDLKLFIDNVI